MEATGICRKAKSRSISIIHPSLSRNALICTDSSDMKIQYDEMISRTSACLQSSKLPIFALTEVWLQAFPSERDPPPHGLKFTHSSELTGHTCFQTSRRACDNLPLRDTHRELACVNTVWVVVFRYISVPDSGDVLRPRSAFIVDSFRSLQLK